MQATGERLLIVILVSYKKGSCDSCVELERGFVNV